MHYAKILIALCCVNFASAADKEPEDYEALRIDTNLPSPSNSLSPANSRHRSPSRLSSSSRASSRSSTDSSTGSPRAYVYEPRVYALSPRHDRCDNCVETCCTAAIYGCCVGLCVGLSYIGIMATLASLVGHK